MDRSVVLCSQVRLARNYEDLPFDVTDHPEFARILVVRTVNALRAAGADQGYQLCNLADQGELTRQLMVERRVITRDLLGHAGHAAAMINEEAGLSIMIGEDDHVRIQAKRAEFDLLSAAAACFRVEDCLSRQVSFAFDEQLGYLTAFPTNTGTGMRASLLMHLPMLTRGKQMGNVGQLVSKVGLNIRGVYGEGNEALADVYQVSNQVTLGRTEQELIATVTALGKQLSDMEHGLRNKAMLEGRTPLEDVIFRAWGILQNARVLPLNEFYQHWSNLRLGAALGLLNLPLMQADMLLDAAQPAHLQVWAEEELDGMAMDEARATRIRGMLNA